MSTKQVTLGWIAVLCLALAACGGSDVSGDSTGGVTGHDMQADQIQSQDSVTPQPDSLSVDTVSGLKWYKSCGAPVCGPNVTPPNVRKCTTEKLGDSCGKTSDRCDAGYGCGATMICAAMEQTNCPISLKRYKTDIRYLSSAQKTRIHKQLMSLRLATWRYRKAPSNSAPRLGFIIDDKPPAVTVHPNGRQVDLYGYSSMAIAAIQVQARQIEALRREMQQLKRQLTSLKERRLCPKP